MSAEDEKERAAAAALDLVEPGMRLGLGTGSTAACFVGRLGERVAAGLDVVAVPTSEATAQLARSLSIPLADLDALGGLDLTVDGADEIDGELNLVKGGGGALLREKIVASASREMVVIADCSKRVARLGRFPLAVEIVTFASRVIAARVSEAAAEAGAQGGYSLRLADDDTPFLTDGGHHIYDYAFGEIAEPARLAAAIGSVPGVVGHGLFVGLARRALIGTPDGVETLQA